jgi:hypothetical protein
VFATIQTEGCWIRLLRFFLLVVVSSLLSFIGKSFIKVNEIELLTLYCTDFGIAFGAVVCFVDAR